MLYVEGGGSKGKVRTDCRKAFRSFIGRAGVKRSVNVVACGSRGDAFNSFEREHRRGRQTALLLVDADGPVTTHSPWLHLQANHGWNRPRGTSDKQCHLMVQIMESWFLADVETLESFFGEGFRRRALPGNSNVEEVPKNDVEDGLARATQGTGSRYKKGRHSFNILAKLDPRKVMKASPHADRFIKSL
jgi:hypothetical protein